MFSWGKMNYSEDFFHITTSIDRINLGSLAQTIKGIHSTKLLFPINAPFLLRDLLVVTALLLDSSRLTTSDSNTKLQKTEMEVSIFQKTMAISSIRSIYIFENILKHWSLAGCLLYFGVNNKVPKSTSSEGKERKEELVAMDTAYNPEEC